MKRIACLVLALGLLLSGCAGAPEDTSVSTEPSTTAEPTTEATTEATTEPTTEATEETTVPTEPPVLYRNPLNGTPLEEPWTGRATAVVINNLENALPQHGVGQADFLYELETEGGITRMLAVFSDVSQVGSIGPIRSARTFFSNIALSYDAPLIHCGGSEFALRGQYSTSSDTIANWNHINEAAYGRFFYRDTARRQAGYAYEHTLFSNGELLTEALAYKGYNTTNEEGTEYGLAFDDDVYLGGESAGSITVTFLRNKTTTMTYDLNTGTYLASQYGDPYVDGNTNAQLSFENVLVLYTSHTFKSDSYYRRSFYDLDGSGNGYYACNGTIVPIIWHRDSLRSSFYYTLEDGTPITLNAGRTYVAVASDTKTISYEPMPVPEAWWRGES